MLISVNGHTLKFKLEPIINIKDGSSHAFEMLSTPIDYDVDADSFFKNLSERELALLIFRRLEYFQKLNEQDSERYHSVFINTTLGMLGELILWRDFVPFIFQFKINLEIDAWDVVSNFNSSKVKHLLALKALGIKLWLDDVDNNHHLFPHAIRYLFYGIKLNKKFVLRSLNSNQLIDIKNITQQWGGERIIAEGVEKESQLNALRYNHVCFGQGFNWEEVSSSAGNKKYPILMASLMRNKVCADKPSV